MFIFMFSQYSFGWSGEANSRSGHGHSAEAAVQCGGVGVGSLGMCIGELAEWSSASCQVGCATLMYVSNNIALNKLKA